MIVWRLPLRLTLLCAGLLLSALCFPRCASAGDISITLDDGKKLWLCEDSTWAFESKKTAKPKAAVTLELEDGRTLTLRPNGRYRIGGDTEEPAKSSKGSGGAIHNVSKITGTGFAKRSDRTLSMDAAKREAMTRVVKQIKTAAAQPDLDDSLAFDCLAKELIDEDFDRAWQPDGAARVTIVINGEVYQKVLSCVEAGGKARADEGRE
jgi:hypothetical protein